MHYGRGCRSRSVLSCAIVVLIILAAIGSTAQEASSRARATVAPSWRGSLHWRFSGPGGASDVLTETIAQRAARTSDFYGTTVNLVSQFTDAAVDDSGCTRTDTWKTTAGAKVKPLVALGGSHYPGWIGLSSAPTAGTYLLVPAALLATYTLVNSTCGGPVGQQRDEPVFSFPPARPGAASPGIPIPGNARATKLTGSRVFAVRGGTGTLSWSFTRSRSH